MIERRVSARRQLFHNPQPYLRGMRFGEREEKWPKYPISISNASQVLVPNPQGYRT